MTEVLVSGFTSAGVALDEYSEGLIELSYSDNGNNWGTGAINISSASSVSLAAFNGYIWVAYRGQSSNTLYVSPSSKFQDVETGQSTNLSPAAAVFRNQLWIAYIGESTGRVEVINSKSGTANSWSGPIDTGQSSKLGPAMIVFQDTLWIAFIGQQSGQIELISSSSGADGSWSAKPTGTGYNTNSPPSLAVFQDQLGIAFVDQSGGLRVISSSNGLNWPSASTSIGKSSKFQPSITAFNDQLWLAFVGESSGQVELVASGGGADWPENSVITGQFTENGPSLAAVPGIQPVSSFGGANQYVFASPQGDGWPSDVNVTLPPISNLLVSINITKDLHFDPSLPLSFQLNCCAPPNGWKIGWQQYVLMMQPNRTEMFLHIQNFFPNNGIAAYAGDSSAQINLPNAGVIPAGWVFELALQYSGNVVTGASCVIVDNNHSAVGALSLSSTSLRLAAKTGTGAPVDSSWLAPIVAFQLVVVGYAESAHTTFTAGSGFVIYESSTPLVAANTWAGSNCGNGGGGTAESSNCAYRVLPNVASLGFVQCFGAPPSA